MCGGLSDSTGTHVVTSYKNKVSLRSQVAGNVEDFNSKEPYFYEPCTTTNLEEPEHKRMFSHCLFCTNNSSLP